MSEMKRYGIGAAATGLFLVASLTSCSGGTTAERDGDTSMHYVVVEGGIDGPATRGDWNSATAEPNVYCGLRDVEHDDIGELRDDSIPDLGWGSPQDDEPGRCGDDFETLMFRLANCERQMRDIPPLRCDLRLVWTGREHSADMRDRDYFDHVSPEGRTPGDRLAAKGVVWSSSAENIAISPTTALAHTAWMESEGHRRNVLRQEVTDLGVGVVKTERGYVMTALFIGAKD